MSMLRYHVWLSSLAGLRAGSARLLYDAFGTPEAVFCAPESAFADIEWLNDAERAALSDKSLKRTYEIIEECQKLDITIITALDADFPLRLAAIPNPPLLLYCKGRLPDVDDEAVIAVAGTRTASAAGLAEARRISHDLASAGCVIASGMAAGIDSAALAGAADGGGTVIAVAGCGADICYPSSSRKVYDYAAANGAVISEYPPGTKPLSYHFPQRNRIISGLAVGVLIVEAPMKSGALITADRAITQGKDVFAMPGGVRMPTWEGSNALLKNGARAVTDADDIINEYAAVFSHKLLRKQRNDGKHTPEDAHQTPENKPAAKPAPPPSTLSDEERAVFSSMESGPVCIDDIACFTGFSAGRILAVLTGLEVSGYIERMPGQLYRIGDIQR